MVLPSDAGGGAGFGISPALAAKAAGDLQSLGVEPTKVHAALTGVTLGAPAAGDGVNAAWTALVAAWTDTLPDLTLEFASLGDKIEATSSTYTGADGHNTANFEQFSR